MEHQEKLVHAYHWIDAWNSHNLEKIVALYDENVQYATPWAVPLTGQGIVNGRDTLRAIWGRTLEKINVLRFQLEFFLQDGDQFAIFYLAQVDAKSYRACERHTLNSQGIITEGESMYGIFYSPHNL